MLFFETSAKTKTNIDKIFYESSKIVYQKIQKKEIDPSNDQQGVKLGTAHQDD